MAVIIDSLSFYDCFVVNVNPLKLTIENQLRHLHDSMLNYLKQSIIRDASIIDSFVELSLETLNMLYLLKQNCSFVELRTLDNHKIQNDCNANVLSLEKPIFFNCGAKNVL